MSLSFHHALEPCGFGDAALARIEKALVAYIFCRDKSLNGKLKNSCGATTA
jgi:hypothetical protein